jgi:hypothetical protein
MKKLIIALGILFVTNINADDIRIKYIYNQTFESSSITIDNNSPIDINKFDRYNTSLYFKNKIDIKYNNQIIQSIINTNKYYKGRYVIYTHQKLLNVNIYICNFFKEDMNNIGLIINNYATINVNNKISFLSYLSYKNLDNDYTKDINILGIQFQDNAPILTIEQKICKDIVENNF